MRIIAPMMILIMMTSTLAGCTGGDPDGEEIDLGISDEVLEQLQLQLDENLTKIIDSELLIIQLQEQLAENSSRINELENNSHEHSDNYTNNEDINLAPIIYRGPSSGKGDCEGCMTYIGASAIDVDGEVVRFGIDVDLDGIIDYNFSSPFTNPQGNEITFEVNYSLMTMYSVEWDSSLGNELENRMGHDGCYLMANIVAVDDEGKSSIHPEVWNRDCE
mgnify:CR=1 FL=1|jgi:hypothetical protein|tara:strand:+ start:185 stop:841 length:657 start_codon:yes stop_codon:yes gene_type:complete